MELPNQCPPENAHKTPTVPAVDPAGHKPKSDAWGNRPLGASHGPAHSEFRNEHLCTFWDALERDDAEEAAKREGWRSPQGYTGNKCEHCGRNRVLICNNGKHVCEKCAWDQDAHQYSDMPI